MNLFNIVSILALYMVLQYVLGCISPTLPILVVLITSRVGSPGLLSGMGYRILALGYPWSEQFTTPLPIYNTKSDTGNSEVYYIQ